MKGNYRMPPIRMAEVFVDGRCVGFLSDVRLTRDEEGAFILEGEWSGYRDVFDKESLFTIKIPRHEIKFLSDKPGVEEMESSGRISFNNASFLPESPDAWFKDIAEYGEA